MKAVILAAGDGTRLGGEIPKALINSLGLPLLERAILQAKDAGINDFIIVLGYDAKRVKQWLKENHGRLEINYKIVTNPHWEEKDNGYSLYLTKDYLKRDKFLILMVDHLLDPEIIRRLAQEKLDQEVIAVGVDTSKNVSIDVNEATKVKLKGDKIVDLGKNLSTYDGFDTGAFIGSKRFFPFLEKSLEEGKTTLSAGIRKAKAEGKVKAVDVGGLFWHDIDNPADLKQAKKVVLKNLGKPSDGPISKYINRPISRRISVFLTKFLPSPNVLSISDFLFSLVAASFFFLGMPIIGGILTQLASIFDGVDGEIARLTFKRTAYGAFIDTILDRFADFAILAGLSFLAIRANPSFFVFFVSLTAIFGSVLRPLVAAHFRGLTKKPLYELILFLKWMPDSRDVRLFIVFLAGVFELPLLGLVVIAFLTVFNAVLRLIYLKPYLEH
ncbi:MAG TPA: hypothetical protein EYP60_06235 [bacterium (Candidatus Stahlbacteria)]|nr:hypothetical protein [Candidatus Stahlbacteria bacterium]